MSIEAVAFGDDMDDEVDTTVVKEDIFHTPCAFNPHGVSKRVCIETSALFVRNRGCCQSECASSVRACRICITQGVEPEVVVNRRSGCCAFHEHYGDAALRSSYDKDQVAPPQYAHTQAGALTPSRKAGVHVPNRRPSERQELRTTGREILDRVRRAMSTAELVTLNPQKIRPMPDQPRKFFDPERLAALSESLRSYGQIMPGFVRSVPEDADGCDHELLDGERRWRASLMADITYRALRIEIDDEAARYVISIIANFNRAEHTTMEISDSIKVMMEELKMTQAEIGEALGMHPVHISRYYGLQRLVQGVRDLLDPNMVKDKKKRLTRSAAFELALLAPHAQLPKAEALLKGEISMTDLRHHAQTSDDRISTAGKRLIHDVHERWRGSYRRAEVISGKVEDLMSVMKNTPAPDQFTQGHSIYMTRQVLERLQRQIGEALTHVDEKISSKAS
jgi:ParB/RepB/Spo0J family partition protein